MLVDVRPKSDYETSPLKLPGAQRRRPEEIDAGRVDLTAEKAQTLVAYDTSPGEAVSERVARVLRQRGWRDVRILKGGLGGWTNAKLPVEAKSSLPSIGLELYKNLTLGDMEKRHFAKGTFICEQGDDPRGEAYVIHSGTVEVRLHENGTVRVLAQQGEGELIGELALFRRGKRSTDLVAHHRRGPARPQERAPRLADPQPPRGDDRDPQAPLRTTSRARTCSPARRWPKP